jgi:hypothetical protein
MSNLLLHMCSTCLSRLDIGSGINYIFDFVML